MSPVSRFGGSATRSLYRPGAVGGHLLSREANYASLQVDEGIGDQDAEQSLRRQAELGRLLSAAAGYRVVAGDGTHVGWLDHVRYEQHADHPDEIVVRRRGLLLKRRRAFPFSVVETVRPRERTVVLRLDRVTLERSPSAQALVVRVGERRTPRRSLQSAASTAEPSLLRRLWQRIERGGSP